MHSVRRVLGVVIAGSVLLAGCGTFGSPTSSPKAPTVLKTAIGVDPDTLDPMRQTTTAVINIVQMVVEGLAKLDPTGKVVPSLAASWQESPDAMTWVFTLRSGISFTDGTPFDAAAVKANLDRDLDPKSVCVACNFFPRSVKSVDVVDPLHVRLDMSQPIAADALLGLLSTGTFLIQSPRGIDKTARSHFDDKTSGYVRQERPVGTGPYVFNEVLKGDHVTVKRNEHYWGARPYYAQQVFEVVPDAATREALIRSGQVGMTVLPPVSDLPSLQKDPTVKVLLAPGDRAIYMVFDTVDRQQPLLQNPQVRQALNYAVNRDAIVKSTLFGAAEPATSVMAPSIFGYCAVPNPYHYDPDLARSLLQKANASNMSLTMVAPTGRYIQDYQAALNIANDLKAVGVNVNGPRTMDWPTYVSIINVPAGNASVDMHLLGFAPGFLDASQPMSQVDPSLAPPKGLETSYYDNPNVTALMAKALVEPNRDARAQEYCDAEKLIWNDAPWLFLWIQKYPIIYSTQVTGVAYDPSESFNTVYVRPV